MISIRYCCQYLSKTKVYYCSCLWMPQFFCFRMKQFSTQSHIIWSYFSILFKLYSSFVLDWSDKHSLLSIWGLASQTIQYWWSCPYGEPKNIYIHDSQNWCKKNAYVYGFCRSFELLRLQRKTNGIPEFLKVVCISSSTVFYQLSFFRR